MRILPIASGKGGVGKSLVAVNLSIALAQTGKRVILADMDLGASNAHTILGLRAVGKGICHFLTESGMDINEIVMKTSYENLRFIPGEAELPGYANLKAQQKKKLVNALHSLDADFLVLDLGAGTGLNTLDLFLCSSEGIIVTTPALTATLNAYLFLKNSVFRLMENSFPQKCKAVTYLEKLKKEGDSLQKIYLPRLFENLKEIDPENYAKFEHRFKNFRPKLILNMIEDPKDTVKASRIRVSCREYLGVEIEHLGIIYRDVLQDIALSSRLPVVIYKPGAVISQAIFRIGDRVLESTPVEDDNFIQDFDDSFHIADIEAESDFDVRINEIKNLLNSGVLSQGDLLETIRTQQFEVKSLKKENNLLKTRLIKAVNEGYKF